MSEKGKIGFNQTEDFTYVNERYHLQMSLTEEVHLNINRSGFSYESSRSCSSLGLSFHLLGER